MAQLTLFVSACLFDGRTTAHAMVAQEPKRTNGKIRAFASYVSNGEFEAAITEPCGWIATSWEALRFETSG